MDTLAISPAASAAPVNSSANVNTSNTDKGFAQTLEQAIGQNSPSSTPTRPALTDAKSTPRSDTQQPSRSAPAKQASASSNESSSEATQPDQSAQPSLQQSTSAGSTEQIAAQASIQPPQLTPGLLPTIASPTDSSATSPSADSVLAQGSGLDEIRRRLALIEQAGKLPEKATADSGLAALALAMQSQPATSAPSASSTQQSSSLATASTVTRLQASDTNAKTTNLHSVQLSKGDLPAAADPIDGQPPSLPKLSDQLADSGTMLLTTAEQPAHRLEAQLHLDPALTSLPASASLTTANSTTPNPNNTTAMTLAAPVGSSEWQQGLGQQLVGLYQRGDKQIDLHLHPADLGPLSISLKLAESGVQAQFIAAHPQVRAAVEQALPELRAALASQGISLGEASVGGQQQPQRDTQDNPTGNSYSATTTAADNFASLPEQPSPTSIHLGNGRVDLYA